MGGVTEAEALSDMLYCSKLVVVMLPKGNFELF